MRAGVGATAGAWVDLAVAAVELHALHDLVVVVDLEGRGEVEEDLLLVLRHLAVDDLVRVRVRVRVRVEGGGWQRVEGGDCG